jgi:hypothetical protein
VSDQTPWHATVSQTPTSDQSPTFLFWPFFERQFIFKRSTQFFQCAVKKQQPKVDELVDENDGKSIGFFDDFASPIAHHFTLLDVT